MAKRNAAKPKVTAKIRRKAEPLAPDASPVNGQVPPPEHRFGEGNQAAVGHGRPRKLAELKSLILDTLAEEVSAQLPDGQRVTMTRAQQMIRTMLVKSPSDRVALLEYAFGKVPQPTTDLPYEEWRKWAAENGYDPDEILNSLVDQFVAPMKDKVDAGPGD